MAGSMDWRDALFLHWPVDAGALRALIPRDLELDVMDGSAWAGIVAFRIASARARGVPARLGLRSFGEVNVRTYVTGGGTPGVWFLSLDAASAVTVRAGRRPRCRNRRAPPTTPPQEAPHARS
ncbi:MAG: DUF2071 domain-containing protein, partial [Candidatus Eremiobacteraeota bacterium]|nr:DUF2071 domain-containing protein [Candidatus Eremiobacteraeota bacterium]